MELQDDVQLSVTKEKLSCLEERYEAVKRETGEGTHVRDLNLHSLRTTINQLIEQIVRYEIRMGRGESALKFFKNEVARFRGLDIR
jgi:hypothetical protein